MDFVVRQEVLLEQVKCDTPFLSPPSQGPGVTLWFSCLKVFSALPLHWLYSEVGFGM